MAIDPLSVAAFLAVITAQGALWYKLGKVESAILNHQAHHEEVSRGHRPPRSNRP